MKNLCIALTLIGLFLSGCASNNDTGNIPATDLKLATGGFANNTPVSRGVSASEIIVAEAVATALYDAGVETLTFSPAVGVATIAEIFAQKGGKSEQFSAPETALALAIGDSMQGKRAGLLLSHEQFMREAGVLLQAALWGSNAGVVIVVVTDNASRYSSSTFDADSIGSLVHLPFFAANSSNAYESTNDAMLTSEKLKIPFMLFVDIDELTKPTIKNRIVALSKYLPYERNIYSNVQSPALAVYQNRVLDAKKLGGNADMIKAPSLPVMPQDLPSRFRRKYEHYAPIMNLLSELRPVFVAAEGSDLSMFAFEPHKLVSAVGFLGSAVPLVERASRAGRNHAWAVMSADDFMRNSNQILEVMSLGESTPKVLILNTNLPEVAGVKVVNSQDFDAELKVFGQMVTRISSSSSHSAIIEQLRATVKNDSPSILVVDYNR